MKLPFDTTRKAVLALFPQKQVDAAMHRENIADVVNAMNFPSVTVSNSTQGKLIALETVESGVGAQQAEQSGSSPNRKRRMSGNDIDSPGKMQKTSGQNVHQMYVDYHFTPAYQKKPDPDWLKKISYDAAMKKLRLSKGDRSKASVELNVLKGYIHHCEHDAVKPFKELRDQIHKAEVALKGIDKFTIRRWNILSGESGLPAVFMAEKVDYPWDIKADAYQLYLRWYDQKFEFDMMAGIIKNPAKADDRLCDKLDATYAGRKAANVYGDDHLAPGQIFSTFLCAMRDGAHGFSQGGIFGERGKGAYSIVISSSSYKDVDSGTKIWYSGTESKDHSTPTEATQRLIESGEFKTPVRVLRSAQLPMSNEYRPKFGLRYDGLYKVVGFEILDHEKQEHLFELVRCEGQLPIRYGDNVAARPTKFEIAEYKLNNENKKFTRR